MRMIDRYILDRSSRDLDAEAAPYRSPAGSPNGKIIFLARYTQQCTCADRPKCQRYDGCDNYADGSAMVWGSWFPRLTFTWVFTCRPCWEHFVTEYKKPIPGWDRPEWADSDWRPSIISVIDLALREINEKARRENAREIMQAAADIDELNPPMILPKGAIYTPEQMKQLAVLGRARRASAA